VPPSFGCPKKGPPSPEVTGVFCRVPSPSFSQAPRYSLPIHLCRFRVRSIMLELFPGTPSLQKQSNKFLQYTVFVTSSRPRNINLVPIDYGFRPRLRGRLTLRGLALLSLPIPPGYLTVTLHRLTERSATMWNKSHPHLRCMAWAPLNLRRKKSYLDQ